MVRRMVCVSIEERITELLFTTINVELSLSKKRKKKEETTEFFSSCHAVHCLATE